MCTPATSCRPRPGTHRTERRCQRPGRPWGRGCRRQVAPGVTGTKTPRCPWCRCADQAGPANLGTKMRNSSANTVDTHMRAVSGPPSVPLGAGLVGRSPSVSNSFLLIDAFPLQRRLELDEAAPASHGRAAASAPVCAIPHQPGRHEVDLPMRTRVDPVTEALTYDQRAMFHHRRAAGVTPVTAPLLAIRPAKCFTVNQSRRLSSGPTRPSSIADPTASTSPSMHVRLANPQRVYGRANIVDWRLAQRHQPALIKCPLLPLSGQSRGVPGDGAS